MGIVTLQKDQHFEEFSSKIESSLSSRILRSVAIMPFSSTCNFFPPLLIEAKCHLGDSFCNWLLDEKKEETSNDNRNMWIKFTIEYAKIYSIDFCKFLDSSFRWSLVHLLLFFFFESCVKYSETFECFSRTEYVNMYFLLWMRSFSMFASFFSGYNWEKIKLP